MSLFDDNLVESLPLEVEVMFWIENVVERKLNSLLSSQEIVHKAQIGCLDNMIVKNSIVDEFLVVSSTGCWSLHPFLKENGVRSTCTTVSIFGGVICTSVYFYMNDETESQLLVHTPVTNPQKTTKIYNYGVVR